MATVDEGLHLINEPKRLLRGTRRDIIDVWTHRELLRAFISRELRSRYKGATLGWAWALVRPLVMLLVYGVAVGMFLGAGRAIPQFMIFIYTGMIAWALFAAIIQGCIATVIANGQLLTRANFPPLLLPLSVVAAALIDFFLQASVLFVGYAIFSDWPQLPAVLWVIPALVALVLTALGVGAAFAAVNVYIRDVGFLVDVGLQIGFWLTPILYAYGQVVRGANEFGLAADWISRLYMLNPMANIVIAFQQALWPAASSDAAVAFTFPGELDLRLTVFSAAGLGIAWIGARVFVKLSANFGQEL